MMSLSLLMAKAMLIGTGHSVFIFQIESQLIYCSFGLGGEGLRASARYIFWNQIHAKYIDYQKVCFSSNK